MVIQRKKVRNQRISRKYLGKEKDGIQLKGKIRFWSVQQYKNTKWEVYDDGVGEDESEC